MSGSNHKRCPGCARYLPRSSFSPDRTKKSGIKSRCRDCVALSKRRNSHPRPSWLDREATKARPAQVCECIGGSLLHEDEGEIRCLRCGKSPGFAEFARLQSIGECGTGVKSLPTDINSPGSLRTDSGARTQKGLAPVPPQSFANPARAAVEGR